MGAHRLGTFGRQEVRWNKSALSVCQTISFAILSLCKMDYNRVSSEKGESYVVHLWKTHPTWFHSTDTIPREKDLIWWTLYKMPKVIVRWLFDFFTDYSADSFADNPLHVMVIFWRKKVFLCKASNLISLFKAGIFLLLLLTITSLFICFWIRSYFAKIPKTLWFELYQKAELSGISKIHHWTHCFCNMISWWFGF